MRADRMQFFKTFNNTRAASIIYGVCTLRQAVVCPGVGWWVVDMGDESISDVACVCVGGSQKADQIFVIFIMVLKSSTSNVALFCLYPRGIIRTTLGTQLVAGCVAGNFRKISSFNIYAKPGRECSLLVHKQGNWGTVDSFPRSLISGSRGTQL